MGNEPTRRSLLSGVAAVVGLTLTACASERPIVPGHLDPIALPPFEMPAVTEPVAPHIDVEAVIAHHEGLVPAEWGMEFAGVVRTGAEAGHAQPECVFLTLDACGGPAGSGIDDALIAGLRAAAVPATLFLNLRWIQAHPVLAAELAADPLFSIQNHGSAHLPLSVTGAEAYGIVGTSTARAAAMEVWENHLVIEQLTGTAPTWFRPGTAHLDDIGLSIADALGERIAGFAINADGGATLPSADVAATVSSATGGEFILAHMNQPGSGTAVGLLAGVRSIQERGITFAKL